jgi:hypothetical protein
MLKIWEMEREEVEIEWIDWSEKRDSGTDGDE